MDCETNIKEEFQEIDSKKAWHLIYQEIREECSKFNFSVAEAKKAKNKTLNRYRDVSPYDHTRIVLSKGSSDYINANIIKMEKAGRQYILTQGPLQKTTDHFWLMVWEQNCVAIIMLNRIIEKNQIKCHQYWPDSEDLVFTEVGLKVEFISQNDSSYYIKRVLRLTEIESGNSREIVQFHYTTWPDFGVPQTNAFLHFLADVRRSGALSPDVGPAVVHCSAGIGRSGTFCLVDSCLVMMKGQDDCTSVKVREVLLEMRQQRMGLIQTPEQLRFSYVAIIEGLKYDWDNANQNDIISNEVNANHCSEGDEEPPPLPPPRGASLLPPLPPVPADTISTASSSPESSRPSSPENENGPLINDRNKDTDGVRLRQKAAEKQKRTAERVAEMKRKQQKAESWSQFKRSLMHPFSLSIGAILLGGVLAYSYYATTRA